MSFCPQLESRGANPFRWSMRLGEDRQDHSYEVMRVLNRYTCAIQLSDSVIMTGGGDTAEGMNMVARYGIDGFMEDLPSLVVGRKEHGCGSYLREDRTQVSTYIPYI